MLAPAARHKMTVIKKLFESTVNQYRRNGASDKA
jgi:hypothetical protein